MQRPTLRQLVRAVKVIAEVTGADSADYCFGGRIAVPLPAGWSLVISPDDAGRFRIEACHSARTRATMWCLADDELRLAELASSMEQEAAALAAA